MEKTSGMRMNLVDQFREKPVLMSLVTLCTLYVGSLIAALVMQLFSPAGPI